MLVIGKQSLCLYLNPEHFSPYFSIHNIFLLTLFLRGKYLFLSEKTDTALPAQSCSAPWSPRCSLHPFEGVEASCRGHMPNSCHSEHLWERKGIHMGWQDDTNKPLPVPAMVLESEHQSEQPLRSLWRSLQVKSHPGTVPCRSSLLQHFLFHEAMNPAPHRKGIFFPSLGAGGKLECQGRIEAHSCRAQPCTEGSPAWMPTQENPTLPLSLYPTSPETWSSREAAFNAWTSEIWNYKDSWDLLKDLSGKHREQIGWERGSVRDRWLRKERNSWVGEH